jgi:hypothetical protein
MQLNVHAQNICITMKYRSTTNHLQTSCITISEHKNGYWTHIIQSTEITTLCKIANVSIQTVPLRKQWNVWFVVLCYFKKVAYLHQFIQQTLFCRACIFKKKYVCSTHTKWTAIEFINGDSNIQCFINPYQVSCLHHFKGVATPLLPLPSVPINTPQPVSVQVYLEEYTCTRQTAGLLVDG